MSERSLQVALNFLAGFALIEIPVVMVELQAPVFDWKHLAVGLLGGVVTGLNRWYQTKPNASARLHGETFAQANPPASMLDDPRS